MSDKRKLGDAFWDVPKTHMCLRQEEVGRYVLGRPKNAFLKHQRCQVVLKGVSGLQTDL